MMNDIDTINRYVAYEQACLGQDDELEDEDWNFIIEPYLTL